MAKNEAKIKFTAETGEFNSQIKKSNDEMSQLRAEFKLNETQMKATGVSVEGLENKHRILSSQLVASEKKTEALSQKVEKAVEIFGENSAEATKLKTQLINAQNAEEKLRQAVNTCSNELEQQRVTESATETATENLTSTIKSQQTELSKLKKDYVDAVLQYGKTSDEAKTLETAITELSSELEQNKQKISNATKTADEFDRTLNKIDDSQKQVETITEKLTRTISEQQSELKRLEAEYTEAVLQYGETSDEVRVLERSINSLIGELRESKTVLSNATDKADDLVRSLDNVDESVNNADDGFTVLKGTIANLVANSIQNATNKIKEFIGYLGSLPDETLELRQDIATLTTSFDNMNFSSETAINTWKELYAVFGEDDRAVETANHIAKMADNQKDLNKWVDIATGVFATYQDSLPVEGLAEASNETAKTGKVTGVLADALNWSSEAAVIFADYMSEDVVTAEDAFNVALSECTTEAEKQALITDTLTKLYGGAADTYRDTASAQMEAKEATVENMLAESNLATSIEPVTTAFTKLKTTLLTSLQPAIKKTSELMIDALHWAEEHPVAMKVIAAVAITLATALGVLAVAMGATTVAQWAMNSAIFANPTTWIVAGIIVAITALVAIIVIIIDYWDVIATSCKESWESVKSTVSSAVNKVKTVVTTVFAAVKEKVSAIFSGIKTITTNAWNSIKNAITTVINNVKTKVISVFNSVKSTVSNVFNNIRSTATSVWNGIKNAITKPIETAKNKVKSMVDSIKGFFSNMKLSLPKIKLPHFKISGTLSLSPPSVPKLSIQWYKDGGIMTRPTIFGFNGSSFMAGGEAGHEAILPIDKLKDYIADTVEDKMNIINLGSLATAISKLAERPVDLNINGRKFAQATASDSDSVSGLRNLFSSRGLAID